MKKNNESQFFKDWTTTKLKQEAKQLDSLINGQHACYGSHDIQMLDGILNELENRGVDFTRSLTFI